MVGKRFLGLVSVLVFFCCACAFNAAAALTVTLAWNPVLEADIAGYRLYQGAESGVYTNVVEVGNSTNGTIADLQAGRTYYFAVTSYNAIGLESVFSEEVSYTPGKPLRPSLQITQNSPNAVTLNGDAQPGYSYDVLATEDMSNWQALTNITVDATGTFSVTDLTAGSAPQRFYQLRQSSP